MKSKKKMLLALGAMSAAAIGAGATSTFAWYQSTAAASAAANVASVTLTTNVGTASAQTVTVNFTFTTSSNPELTNDDGESWYYLDAGKTQLKQNNSEVGVGVYSVSVGNLSEADKTIWQADTSKGATEDVEFTLTATSPVVLLKADASTTAGAKGAASGNVVASATIVVTITKATGGCAIKSGGSGKFGVRADEENIEVKATLEDSLSSCLSVAAA